MSNQFNSPSKTLDQEAKFKAQLLMVLDALKLKPMTMLETDKNTGVMRSNICRHIDILLKQGLIAITKKRKCSITGYPYVNEYTADQRLFPKTNQLQLF